MSKCEKKCEDCIHCGLCLNIDRLTLFDKNQPAHCKAFKDKSLFVELPCKVGDKVYHIRRTPKSKGGSYVVEAKVWSIMTTTYQSGTHIKIEVEYISRDSVCEIAESILGKYAFVTEEQAKAKLKEMG